MIIPVLIIAGAVLSAMAIAVLILNLIRASDGGEDETGFHPEQKKGSAPKRYRAIKSKVPDSKLVEPFESHSPAA